MDLNKVMIIGRLTRDPELRTTPGGANVCQMSLATNYVYTNQQSGQKVEQVEFHNIVLWRKLGDIAAQYLKKGRRVYIEGRLQTRGWEKDGQKKSRTEIVADNMIMLDSGMGSQAGASSERPAFTPSVPPASVAPVNDVQAYPVEELPTIQQGEDLSVEDIPF